MTAAGYEIEPGQRIGFAVKGVPPELREMFSKRRQEILRQAAETGAKSQDELQSIAVRSRAEKTKATAATLRERWLAEAGPHLETLRAVIAGARGRSAKVGSITSLDAIRSAEAHVFERKSVVDDRLLLREALIAGRGQVALDALKRALASRERSGELIRVGEEIASREGLETENEFTGWASAQRKGHKRLGAVPAAALILRDGHAAPEPDVLKAWLKERLLPYQVPVHVRVVDDFPRTPSMKPSAPGLQALFKERFT